MNKLIDIFFDVDDFCHKFLPVWEAELIADGVKNEDVNLTCPQVSA